MTSALLSFRPHRAGSRCSPEGSRACLARSGDCEPSLGAVGVLRRCCSGGGASLCRKLCRVGHRPQVPRAALQPWSRSPSAKQSSADARALAGGPRRGVVATARLDTREASAIMRDFLAGRFGCSLRHACLLANYSLQVTECLSALQTVFFVVPSKRCFSPLESYISSGRVVMRIFYYINRSAILFYSYYVLEASSQSFVVKSYGANKCVC